MHLRNLALVVLVAAPMVACESVEQQTQRVSKKLAEDGYREALVELPGLEARLFANQNERENGVVKGGDIYLKHCASCHGEYAQGGDDLHSFIKKDTGERVQFKPPILEPLRFSLDSDRERQKQDYARQIKDGGRYMPPIKEFPHDESGNPYLEAVRKIIDYILEAPKLSMYRKYVRQGKPK